jgi:hypothetical protein
MIRKFATVVILTGMAGFTLPRSVCQIKESAGEERSEHRKAQRDVPAEMQRARQALENAKNELAHAGDEWGGHRVAAIEHVEKALEEIRRAEEYAKEHKLVK